MKNNNFKSTCKVCKICNRCFSSGKAMGGHMRSHFAKLPIPPKPNDVVPPPPPPPPPTENYALGGSVYGGSASSSSIRLAAPPPPPPIGSPYSSNSSSSSLNNIVNPWNKQNFRSLSRDFPADEDDDEDDENRGIESDDDDDDEYPTRRRSKRRRKFIAAGGSVSSPPKSTTKNGTNSMFDAMFPAIEAARSLVMLSRDKWPEENRDQVMFKKHVEDDGDDDLFVRIRSQVGRFECEYCNKVFGSYQALGGHKASHNKKLSKEYDGSVNLDQDPKAVYECVYCTRVFESGQALGGHKKAHFPTGKKFGINVHIDLNLPADAEEEDDDGEEVIMSGENYN